MSITENSLVCSHGSGIKHEQLSDQKAKTDCEELQENFSKLGEWAITQINGQINLEYKMTLSGVKNAFFSFF